MQVELYTRRGSPPCEAAKLILERVRAQVPFDLVEVDIDLDDKLRAQFDRDVPVVYVDGRKAFRREVDEQVLLRKLERGRAFAMGTLDPRANLTRGRPVGRRTKVLFVGAAALAIAGVFVNTGFKKLLFEPQVELRALDVMQENFPAPSFALPDAKGSARALDDFKGKVVFLNFWASWCAPCREEMPDMARLAISLAPHRDFAMVTISVDPGWDPIRAYFGEQFGSVPPPFIVLLDKDSAVSEAYGTHQYPESYVIDRGGKVIAKFAGPRDWADPAAKRYLERLLD
jgi:thiol-disulfide isomerase/thioredoxin/glutaredoxin